MSEPFLERGRTSSSPSRIDHSSRPAQYAVSSSRTSNSPHARQIRRERLASSSVERRQQNRRSGGLKDIRSLQAGPAIKPLKAPRRPLIPNSSRRHSVRSSVTYRTTPMFGDPGFNQPGAGDNAIGMALGSPPPAPAANWDLPAPPAEVSADKTPADSEIRQPMSPTMAPKSSKWKGFGGIFGKKFPTPAVPSMSNSPPQSPDGSLRSPNLRQVEPGPKPTKGLSMRRRPTKLILKPDANNNNDVLGDLLFSPPIEKTPAPPARKKSMLTRKRGLSKATKVKFAIDEEASVKSFEDTRKEEVGDRPVLDIDIPRTQLDRYSVMFGPLLKKNSEPAFSAQPEARLVEESIEEEDVTEKQPPTLPSSNTQLPLRSLPKSHLPDGQARDPPWKNIPASRLRGRSPLHNSEPRSPDVAQPVPEPRKHAAIPPPTATVPRQQSLNSPDSSARRDTTWSIDESRLSFSSSHDSLDLPETPIIQGEEPPTRIRAISSPHSPPPKAEIGSAFFQPSSPPSTQPTVTAIKTQRVQDSSPSDASLPALGTSSAADVSIARQISLSQRQLFLPLGVSKSDRLVSRNRAMRPVMVDYRHERGDSLRSQRGVVDGF